MTAIMSILKTPVRGRVFVQEGIDGRRKLSKLSSTKDTQWSVSRRCFPHDYSTTDISRTPKSALLFCAAFKDCRPKLPSLLLPRLSLPVLQVVQSELGCFSYPSSLPWGFCYYRPRGFSFSVVDSPRTRTENLLIKRQLI